MEEKQSCHHAQCVRLVPIFNHLEDAEMDMIAASARVLHLQKGEILFHAGERDDTLYIVNSGKVRMYRLSDSGKEQLVRILHPGDFTGEYTIFQPGSTHENYAEALENTSICQINQVDVQRYLVEYPEISLKILSEVTKRLESSERQTAQVAIENVESRLIAYLLELVEKESNSQPIVTLPMSKKDLASYLGTTPESISRKFTSLEQHGLIEQLPKKRIKILDVDELLFHAE